MGQILLIRHGQASLLAGDYDCLSQTGWTQGRRTGAALSARGVVPDLLRSGSLRRQRDTAQALVQGGDWALDPDSDPDFDEYSFADLFGATWPALTSHAAVLDRLRGQPDPRRAFQQMFETAFRGWTGGMTAPGALSWRAFADRCMDALARVALACGSGQVAVVVTSGGVIAAVVQRLLHVPDAQALDLHNPLRNAGITRLLTRGSAMALASFNEVAHLEDATDRSLLTYR